MLSRLQNPTIIGIRFVEGISSESGAGKGESSPGSHNAMNGDVGNTGRPFCELKWL